MTTGNFSDWNGNMFDIGPIYPFVGWEVPMVILGIIFWIGWHYLQIRMENRTLDEQAAMLRQGGNLAKAVQAEHTLERM
jgi:predicted negative regulator of RcsB-dependent stress response